jgi:hypothetical protein
MTTVNAINPKIDLSVRVFDNFYNYSEAVPANEYDIVNSYFESVMGTKTAAMSFTTAVFRVANVSGVGALTVLKQVQSSTQDALTLNLIMAYFLNGIRSPSTLLGVNGVSTPNVFVARNIKA